MISDKCDNRNMCDPECPDSSRTLGIIHEFRKLYEDKMSIIDAEGSGDCNLQAKLSLQHDWIRDLNEQNEMLVRSVEELEQEATERVVALEEKLRQSSKCASEVMNSYKDLSNAFQQVAVMQEDIITLVEFIKRSYEDRTWNIPQLKLNTVHIDTNANDFNGHDDLQVSADQQVNIMDKVICKYIPNDVLGLLYENKNCNFSDCPTTESCNSVEEVFQDTGEEFSYCCCEEPMPIPKRKSYCKCRRTPLNRALKKILVTWFIAPHAF